MGFLDCARPLNLRPCRKKTETNLDGSVLRVTGNATVEQHISYSVDDPSGNITQQVISGSSSSSAIMRTTRDWARRVLAVEKPGWSGSVTRNFTHDNYGHLIKESQSGSSLADKHYAYDTMGFLKWEGIRLSGSGALDNLSKDRITNYTWEFFSTGTGVWWRRDATSTYATDNSSTATPLSKVETQLSGFSAAGSGYTRLSRADSHDVFGNVTTSYAEVNRSAKTLVQTTVAPDATTSVNTSTNGLLVSAKGFTGHTTTFGYDDLGRMVTSVDPRTGTTTTAYMAGTSQVHTVTDGKSKVQATYAYDDSGRVKSVKDSRDYYTRYEYTKRGEPKRQWGSATYPVAYAYDSWGRRTGMTTYASSTTTFGDTWPSGTGLPDNPKTTVWHYAEASGLLAYKEDAAGKRVNYTYTDLGQVKTREWARFKAGSTTDHVKATYHYFGEQSGELKTGELRQVDYNDTITPDVSYTYNRLGRIATVADADSGTRTFNYALGGALELQSEVLPAYFDNRHITYGYDTATGKKGRPNSLKLGSSSSAASDQDIAYGYDAVGRLDSVAAGGQTFAYTYEANSDLIKEIQNSALTFKDVRTYDPKHDWVDDRETSWGSTPAIKAKFAYAQNDIGHVTDVTKTGELFERYYHVSTNTGLKTSYAYNGRGEITSETSADLHTAPNPIVGRQDTDYAYDALGNRLSHTHNGQTIAYTPDDLNRYTRRDVPGSFDVAGRAPGSTVTVTPHGGGTSYTAARNGKYFFQAFPLANTGSAVFAQLDIADSTSPTPNTGSVNAYVAKDDEVFGYDDDGNLTSDGRWIYAYDAENRLIAMETDAASAPSGLTRQKLAFAYDYLGRRISKTVQNWTGSAYAAAHVSLRYVYNGWNLMAELDHLAGDGVVRSYYWGLDLSGSGQGAGGVGGLLMVQGDFFNSETASTDTGKTLVALYDAMGNVHGMLNSVGGTLDAAYEYDAFGKTLRESGPYAGSNPLRYSTKYTDIETGLVYYGLRYYSPSLGRFINKDPIEEEGGLNLYAFCKNNGVNRWDYLGMDDEDVMPFFSLTPWLSNEDLFKPIWVSDPNEKAYQQMVGQRDAYTIWNERETTIRNYEAELLAFEREKAGISTNTDLGDILRSTPLIGTLLGTVGDVVMGLVGGTADMVSLGAASGAHFGRDEENTDHLITTGFYGRTDITLAEARQNYDQASVGESLAHRLGEENAGNIKLTSPTQQPRWWNRYGRYELILRPNPESATYTEVHDAINGGTLNYGQNPVSHTILDVLPYLIFGNSDKPTNQTPREDQKKSPPPSVPQQSQSARGTTTSA